MKKLTFLVLALVPYLSSAALLEQKDLVGRLMVQDQQSNRVSGVITLTATPKNNTVILEAKLNQFNMEGVTLPTDAKCEGKLITAFRDPQPSLQRLEIRCVDDKKKPALTLSIHLSGMPTAAIVSYLNGSFGEASLNVADHGNKTKPIQSLKVEFKNLDPINQPAKK